MVNELCEKLSIPPKNPQLVERKIQKSNTTISKKDGLRTKKRIMLKLHLR
eukprot:UN15757